MAGTSEQPVAEVVARYNPEVPFRRCDDPSTVESLENRLRAKGIITLRDQIQGLNRSGRDCVFIALKYGVKPSSSGGGTRARLVRDAHRKPDEPRVNLDNYSVDEIRVAIAEHIVKIWGDRSQWAWGALQIHIDNEARNYLGLPNATSTEVRDAYVKAIKGEGRAEKMFGDIGCILAFASRFNCAVVCFSPPRPGATLPANQLYHPAIYGNTEAARRGGNRTACLMMFYVLDAGVGHAEPLLATLRNYGAPSSFTACTFEQLRDPNFCPATGRAIVSAEAEERSLDGRREELFGGILESIIVSITFGKLSGEVPSRLVERFRAVTEGIRDLGHIEEGVCMTERGDTNFRKHLQGMFVIELNNALSLEDASLKLREYYLLKMDIVRQDPRGNLQRQSNAENIHLKVICRKEDDAVKREAMLGYALKEMGNRWSQTVFRHNMSAARLRGCREEYLARAGYNVFKRRTLLLPTGWMDLFIKYEHLMCFPLSIMMHTVHVVRFMLIDGKYAFSPKWMDATGGSAVDQNGVESYRQILQMLRLSMRHVYVHDIFMVLNRGRQVQANKQHYEARNTEYDSMPLTRMKKLNLAAKRVVARQQAERLHDDLDVNLGLIQLPVFDIEELEQELLTMGNEPAAEHPAVGFEGILDEDEAADREGDMLGNEAAALIFDDLEVEANNLAEAVREDDAGLDRLGDVNDRLQNLDVEDQ